MGRVDHRIGGGSVPPPSPDGLIARIAAKQHGVVCRAQLLAAGVGRRAIEARLSAGRLHPLHRGVYAVGHRAVGPRGNEMAAVLACGDRAVLSHHSAAALWGMRPPWRGPVHVLGRHTALSGVVAHKARALHPRDTTRHPRRPHHHPRPHPARPRRPRPAPGPGTRARPGRGPAPHEPRRASRVAAAVAGTPEPPARHPRPRRPRSHPFGVGGDLPRVRRRPRAPAAAGQPQGPRLRGRLPLA